MKPDVKQHGPFYSLCQAVFYIFIFRHEALLEAGGGTCACVTLSVCVLEAGGGACACMCDTECVCICVLAVRISVVQCDCV